jgi:hypothetical protein
MVASGLNILLQTQDLFKHCFWLGKKKRRTNILSALLFSKLCYFNHYTHSGIKTQGGRQKSQQVKVFFEGIDTIIYVPMKIYVPMCQNRTLIFYDFYDGSPLHSFATSPPLSMFLCVKTER